MASRTTVWIKVLGVNDTSTPILVSGKSGDRIARPEYYQLCKKLKPQHVQSIVRALRRANDTKTPIALDVIPQKQGRHTIMGLA